MNMIDQEESEKCEKYGVIHEIQTSLIIRADGKTSVIPIKPNYGPIISHSNSSLLHEQCGKYDDKLSYNFFFQF